MVVGSLSMKTMSKSISSLLSLFSDFLSFFISLSYLYMYWCASDEVPTLDEVPSPEKQRSYKDEIMSVSEMRMVTTRLQIPCQEEEGEDTKYSILGLFDEEEPSLEEIRMAFDVFDQNRDGFIDAHELGRVLSGLGFLNHLGPSHCQSLIDPFDKDQDGFLDFHDFLNLMELCLH